MVRQLGKIEKAQDTWDEVGMSLNLRNRRLAVRKWLACAFMTCALDVASVHVLAQIGTNFSPAAQTEAALKSLSPQDQAVMERLDSLGTIPLGDLSYHAGLLPNGASVELNDDAWQKIQIPFTAANDEVWLRKSIVISQTLNGYDSTGVRVWLQEPTRGDVTVYANGRRIAHGEDMEPLVLLESAKAGDRILLAIHLGRTQQPKQLRRMSLHYDFPANRPNPAVLREELLAAAILSLSLAPGSAQVKDALDKAIAIVDLKALDVGDGARFDASLNQARELLAQIEKGLPQTDFHLTGNSHIDAAWLWPWTETVDVVHRTFGSAAQLMDEYPTYTFTQSAAQYNVWMADKYPDLNARIKKYIQLGRWEIVGGMWIEPDLNMPDGESLVRQLLVGKRTYKQLYGIDIRIGWNPDSFGYNWQLPQIYKKSGIDYFVTQKMSWNETNKLPLKLFWWESPDGSKVLTYFPDGYDSRDFNPVRLSNSLLHARTLAPGINEIMDLYGVGDHGGGPTRSLLDEGLRWLSPDRVTPKIELGTAQRFFNDMERQIASQSPTWNYASAARGETQLPTSPEGQVSIPTWNDELYLEFHRGVYTTQSNHKRNMRESEEELLNAEKYSSLAWLNSQPYPAAELTDAWKKALFNQFHDLAAGSGIGVIYRDSQEDYDQVKWATQQVSSKALITLAEHIDTRTAAINSTVPVMVMNPLAWQRSGLVETDVQIPEPSPDGVSVLDSDGRVLPSKVVSSDKETGAFRLLIDAKEIPALGYEVLRVVPGRRSFATDMKVSGTTLENRSLRVRVDPKSGCITSLYDKMTHFESLAADSCGNELIAFKDTPKMFDAWNIDADFDKSFTKLDKADSVEVIENNPLRATIRVTHTWQGSKFVQDIVLNDGSDEVDVVNDIDWHETHVLLKAAFDLAATSPMATYEIPYGTIERPTTRNNSWEAAKFEVPALRWADLGDGTHGFSLINESKFGYDAAGHTLRISLLRSPTDPDPNADRGHHHFRYALYPHGGGWQQALTVRRGYEYNYPLIAMRVNAHAGTLPSRHSFASSDAQNVILTAVKKAEDSDALIFRFYEWAGRDGEVRLRVPQGATGATLANLLEQPQGENLAIQHGDTVAVPTHPYEIVTVKVNYAKPVF
jgi:alpha-mannosidase